MNKMIPPTTIERYFSLHYAIRQARKIVPKGTDKSLEKHIREDACIARHHNGICVVCISPKHPIVTERRSVVRVEYRAEMREVRGKKKKGGIMAHPETNLCEISCDSGDVYAVRCCVKGTIVEYNTELADNPNLVMEKPLTNGYLAVVLPRPDKIKTAVDDLLNADKFEEYWEQQQEHCE